MVIGNAHLCDPYGEYVGDVRIDKGVIVQIGENLSDEDERIDAQGCYLLPSLVDTNVSLKDGQLNGKNLTSLARYALVGGVGTVVLNSDVSPQIDNEITLEFVHHHRHTPSGAVIECSSSALNDAGGLSNSAILLKKGALAISATTGGDYNQISRVAQYCQMSGKTLFFHAVDSSLFESGVMADGAVATQLGLSGISPLSEIVHVASMIEVARHFGITIVFKNMTEPRSIELIASAATAGVSVKCEVGIHHLIKTDEACSGYDSDAKINPPLVSEIKRLALIEALQGGKIDLLSALHHPNSDIHKDVTFNDAHFGTTSIGEYLPLSYTYLIHNKLLSWQQFLTLACENPAAYVGMSKGKIAIGEKVDLVLFDPQGTTPVFHHHSLYKNEQLLGKVTMAFQGESVTRF
jgi:dihydroorotase